MKRGFTYLELLVSVSILAILTSICLIKFNNFEKMKEDLEIKEFCRDISWCQNLALTKRTNAFMQINIEENSYYIYTMAGYEDYQTPIKNIHKEKNLSYVKVISDNLDDSSKGGRVSFNKNGSPKYSGTIRISASQDYDVSIIPVTGNVNLKEVGDGI